MQNRVTPSASSRSATCFSRRGRIAPRPVEGAHRFRAGPRLAVDMRHGGRAPDVGDVSRIGRARTRVEEPHGSHGYVRLGPHGEVIPELRAMVLEGLRVIGEPAGMGYLGDGGVVLAHQQIADGAPVVEQKPVRRSRVRHHVSRQGRKPGQQVVAAQPREPFPDPARPVLRPRLDAVAQQGVQKVRADQARGRCRNNAERVRRRACLPRDRSLRPTQARSSGPSATRRTAARAIHRAAHPSAARRPRRPVRTDPGRGPGRWRAWPNPAACRARSSSRLSPKPALSSP